MIEVKDYYYRLAGIALVTFFALMLLMMAVPGCFGYWYDGEQGLLTQAQRAVQPQNKAPPDPNSFTELREVLRELCYICENAGYKRGRKDGMEYQKEKGCAE